MKRVFLGIDLPDELKLKIENLKLDYKLNHLPIKLVEKENSHIAIKFLDELNDGQIKALTDIVEQTLSNFKSFEVSINDYLVFPDLERPRILALKVISVNLEGLVKKLLNSFEPLDFIVQEERPYTPHITLGRIKEKLTELQTEKITSIKFEKKFYVGEIHLFESQLSEEGPVYNILKTFELK